MNTKAGEALNLIQSNSVVKGCTVSNKLFNDGDISVVVFSLAASTSISSSQYETNHLITVEEGNLSVLVNDHVQKLSQHDSLLTPKGALIQIMANQDSIYAEVSFTKDPSINPVIEAGKVFRLTELVPYQQGKIVNLDLVTGKSFKLALMALDAGTALAEHAAPGNAMIFALDGQGIVNYEGKDNNLTPQTVLKLSKHAHHSVTAKVPYKMALLVMTPSTNE